MAYVEDSEVAELENGGLQRPAELVSAEIEVN